MEHYLPIDQIVHHVLGQTFGVVLVQLVKSLFHIVKPFSNQPLDNHKELWPEKSNLLAHC